MTRPGTNILIGIGIMAGTLAICAVPAKAGWEIHVKEVTNWEGGLVSGQAGQRILVQHKRCKNVTIAENGQPAGAHIWDFEADRLTRVDDSRRQYVTGSFTEWVQLFGIKRRWDLDQGRTKVRRTEQRERIAGYIAVRHDVPWGVPVLHVWVAEDLRVREQIDLGKAQRLVVAMPPLMLFACPTLEAVAPEADPSWDMLREGFVMRRGRADGTSTEQVVQVQKRTIPSSEFQPPAGFVNRPLSTAYGPPRK